MRLAFPSAKSLGLWELVDLDTEENEAEAEEGCRLVYVGASRARDRLILSGIYKPGELEPAEPRPSDSPLRRLLPALRERGWDGGDGEIALPGPEPVDGAGRLPDADPARPDQRPEPRAGGRAGQSARPARPSSTRSRARTARRRCSTTGPRPCPSATSPTRRWRSTSAAATGSTSSGCSGRRESDAAAERAGRRARARARAGARGRQRGPRGARVECAQRLATPA